MSRFFIDFEGIDGSGKGTLMQRLREELLTRGYEVVMAKEPGGTDLGLKIRQLLFHDPTTHAMAPNVCDCLFLADHLQNVETVVKPALDAGKVVIADRYAYSQFAYGIDREVHPFIGAAYKALIGPAPDLLFLLSGTPENLLARANGRSGEAHQGGKRWNNADSQRRIQDAYFRQLCGMKQTVVVDTDILNPTELFDLYVWPNVESRLVNPEPGRRHCVPGFVADPLPPLEQVQ